jgi:hypothetical protein
MRKLIFGSAIIVIAALSRLLPHPMNFVPITAIALVGGMYFDKKYAFVIPLLAMLLSDTLIGFHATIPFVYGGMVLSTLIGIWIQARKSWKTVLGGTLASSVIFFIVTNFGVWLTGGGWYYPKTVAGLIECFTLAIPFFRNSLAGDILYTGVLIGLFEAAEFLFRTSAKRASETL